MTLTQWNGINLEPAMAVNRLLMYRSGRGRCSNPKTSTRSNTEKDPDDWISGDEPMTGAQASYLITLCEQAHRSHDFHENLTKAEASKMIDEMRPKAGVGARSNDVD
jgi:Protein of unknown function (DUF3072)